MNARSDDLRILKLDLTDTQRLRLEPLFEAVRACNQVGVTSAIGAQIWSDGIVVKLFTGEPVQALSKALGGGDTQNSASARQRMSKENHDAR